MANEDRAFFQPGCSIRGLCGFNIGDDNREACLSFMHTVQFVFSLISGLRIIFYSHIVFQSFVLCVLDGGGGGGGG